MNYLRNCGVPYKPILYITSQLFRYKKLNCVIFYNVYYIRYLYNINEFT